LNLGKEKGKSQTRVSTLENEKATNCTIRFFSKS
jgi:hypothetical protein